jgi:predicted enzyme related to lactoylglutathione lyase
MSNPVVWFEVMGQDADKLRNFYGQLLGWKFRTENPLNDPTNYGFVEAGEGGIEGGIGQIADDPGWSTFYTKVSDLEGAVDLAMSLGSRVRLPITVLPETRIAVVSDPNGNAVGLCADRTDL